MTCARHNMLHNRNKSVIVCRLIIDIFSAKIHFFFKYWLPILSFWYKKAKKARKRVNNKVVKEILFGQMDKKK